MSTGTQSQRPPCGAGLQACGRGAKAPRHGSETMRVMTSLGRLVRVGLFAGAIAAATVDRPASAMPTRPIRFTRLSLEQGLSQSTVLCVFQDSRGYIWLGTEDGLNRFDGVKFTVYKNDPADPW